MLDAFFDEDSYKLYIKYNDKYKVNMLEIVFVTDYSIESLVYLDIIKYILLKGPINLTYQKFLKQLESFYDVVFTITNTRVGKSVLTKVNIKFLNSKYNKINSLNNIIKLIYDTFNNPKFDLEDAKKNLINERLINNDNVSIKNIKQALSYTDKNIFFDDVRYDNIINSLTMNKVKDFYKDFIEYSKKYIYFIGDYPSNKVYSIIKRNNKFNSIQSNKKVLYLDDLFYKRCKNISINKNLNYLEIIQIYTYHGLTNFEKNYCLPIFNMIIGSTFLNSIIFNKLREEEGLIYSFNTFYRKHDNMLILETSLSKKNYNKAIRIIRNSFKLVRKGAFNKELIEEAKKLVINSLNSKNDTIDKLISNEEYKTIFKGDDIDIKINNYKKVSFKDIVKVSNKIKLIINYRKGESYEEN